MRTLTEEYDFELPQELIATHPTAERAASRLLVTTSANQSWEHHVFSGLPDLLREGDLMVLNDTRVLPARVLASKTSGGRVEALFLEQQPGGLGLFMLSGGRLRPGVELLPDHGEFRLRLVEKVAPGRWLIEHDSGGSWSQFLSVAGRVPLPPYIRTRRIECGEAEECSDDRERYQTVWASSPGAVAAPTASLHLDQDALVKLEQRGVELVYLTLHVGEGTFLPVTAEHLEDHPIHAEQFDIPDSTAARLEDARQSGRRVVVAGTTSCRAVESFAATGCRRGSTNLFITPGYEFGIAGALLTNFHTPRSTLLAMVAAFAQHSGAGDGLALVKRVYAAAVADKYRFYSYGDASLWQ